MKFTEDIVKYNLKFPWGMRRAINRAISRRIFALPRVLLSELPSVNHILLEIIADNLELEIPPIELDTDLNRQVTLMFQTPSRIKRAFRQLCEIKGISQNQAINDTLSHNSFPDLEARVKIDPALPKEYGQGFTCALDAEHKIRIFRRCAEKIMECDGRRQWGIGDLINIMLAAETGEPLHPDFFEERDMPDDKEFSMTIAMPVSMHAALFAKSKSEGIPAARLLNKWIETRVKQQGI